MPKLNMDCVRDMMLYLEKNQRVKSKGSIKPIHMKRVYPEIKNHTTEECYLAAYYIFNSQLATSADDYKKQSPHFYVFTGFTPQGFQFLQAIHSDTAWARIKAHLKSTGSTAVSTVIEAGISLLLGQN